MAKMYTAAGVDLDAGDEFSSFAAKICASSYRNSPFVEVLDLARGHFRGPRAWRFVNLPDGYVFDAAPDGIGTKVILDDAADMHVYSARNLFAMTGGDHTRWGGLPLVFCNVFDVASLGEKDSETRIACMKMLAGLGKVAREQNVVLFRGETAELRDTVTSENPDATVKYNWAGFMIGVLLEDRVITGASLKEGQVVVALHEPGPRSNGISAIRRGLRLHYGTEWWKNPDAVKDIHDAAIPSTLYDHFLTQANGWTNPISDPRFDFHLIAHISGGGIVDKFASDILFRYGFSAELTDLFPPPDIIRNVVEWTPEATEEDAYRTFSCGNGVLVVLDEAEVDGFIEMARSYGVFVKRAGVITKSNEPYLRITSGFSGKDLEYHPKSE